MVASPSSGNGAPRQQWFIDPAAIMQIKNLTLRAKTVAEGFANGLHRSPLNGFSVEFAQYRPYVVGDDTRNLDWKLLARTDRYYVKQFEDETNRRCYLAMDQSRSMAYGSQAYSKAEYARTLAATLAYFLHMQRDAIGVMTCGTDASEYLPPRHRAGHLQQLMALLGLPSDGQDIDLGHSVSQLAGLSHRRGLVVLISDFLLDPESLYQPLGYLRGRGHELLAIRILDPNEVNFQLDQGTMLRDMESGREIYVDANEARQEYNQRFQVHEEQLLDICHKRGARLITLTTDQPLDFALLELISNSASLSASLADMAAVARNSQRAMRSQTSSHSTRVQGG